MANRGQGIRLDTKYKWHKQPNGKYTVFDVPIFAVYEKEVLLQDGTVGKNSLDSSGLEEVVSNFLSERKSGYYPPIFLGHHASSVENRHVNATKVGFADSLHVNGDTILADLTEIDEKTFLEILKLDYPSRSVEFDGENKIITGIALLKSRRPYFQFPILALEDEELNMLEDIKVQQYQNRKKVLHFQEEIPVDKPGEEQNSEITADSKMETLLGLMKEMMGMLSARNVPAENPEPIAMQAPVPVPFQAPVAVPSIPSVSAVDIAKIVKDATDKMQLSFQKEIDSIKESREASIWADRLRTMCEVTGEDFDSHKKYFEDFESNKDREKFLTYLEVQFQKYPESSATRFLQTYNVDNTNEMFSDDKYKSVPKHVLNVAKRAIKDYALTINQKNTSLAKHFQKRFPSEQYFIDYVIGSETNDPGAYDREFLGK